MNSARTFRLARKLLALNIGQADPRLQQFAANLRQEVAKWQQYEINGILQALATHGQKAGFSQQEIQRLQQNFQQLATKENMQTAVQMIINSPDLVYHGHHGMI